MDTEDQGLSKTYTRGAMLFHARGKGDVTSNAYKQIAKASSNGRFFTNFSDERLSFIDSSVLWFFKSLSKNGFSIELYIEHNLDKYSSEEDIDEDTIEEYDLLFHDVAVNFELLLSASMLETLAEAEEHGIIKSISFNISWF